MPVDIGRPGNSASSRRSERSKYTRATHADSSNDRGDGLVDQLKPPMFAHGLPPPCAGIIAFRRVRKVRQFFVNTAARLLNQTNMADSTQASLGVRQTDQEMMWFELMHGPPAKQPYLLELPEEYYCPAAPGSQQSQDYFRLWRRRQPNVGHRRKILFHSRAKGRDRGKIQGCPSKAKDWAAQRPLPRWWGQGLPRAAYTLGVETAVQLQVEPRLSKPNGTCEIRNVQS